MKIRKVIGINILLILLIGLSGCGNKTSQNNDNKQPISNQTQNNSTVQIDNGVQNNTAMSNVSKGSHPSQSNPPKTQKDVINKLSSVLNTNVPKMLPTDVPVDNGDYLTATTVSEKWNYKVNFYQNIQPEDIDSATAAKGKLVATVEGTEYKNAASAKEAINGYSQVDTSKYPDMDVDLGHNIKALADAGMGHGYLTWNEGRWCIRLDSPNDSAYKNEEYPDSKKLAEKIVEYLNNYMLPAPEKIGVISVNNWNNLNGTTIKWQYNQMVYTVWSQDPMTALKTAVAMNLL